MFDLTNILAGGAVVGIVASCWSKIKAVLWRIASMAIVRVELSASTNSGESWSLQAAITSYLLKHYRKSFFYDKKYGIKYEYEIGKDCYSLIPYESFWGSTLTFWRGCFPIIFSTHEKITLTYLRWTFDSEEILAEACKLRGQIIEISKSTKQQRFFISKLPGKVQNSENNNSGTPWYYEGHYRLLAHSPNKLGRKTFNGKAVDRLVFPEHVKKLIREIQIWRNKKQWYVERNIQWKRGWLLYGPGGTGKTALIRAFAEDEDMPLFVFDLSQMNNKQLEEAWEKILPHSPCIALFEDIDNIFHGRKNVTQNSTTIMMPSEKKDDDKQNHNLILTFDCFLNVLDGIEKNNGIFTVLTTNDISKIDSALGQPCKDGSSDFISSRPGRIDKAIELTYLNKDCKIEFAHKLLSDCPVILDEVLKFITDNPDLQETPAQFQERCNQKCLSYLENNHFSG